MNTALSLQQGSHRLDPGADAGVGRTSRRSLRALIGAAMILASYLAAIGAELILGGGSATVVHFVMGAGFVVFATSVFDFALPRSVNVVGAAAAGLFGTIFLLQGVADVTQLDGLRYVAFDVLGHQLERLLPDVVYVWFVALLFGASRGKTRVLGAATMLVVVASELAALATLVLGVPLFNLKFALLLPFVWVLFEAAKRRPIR